MQQTNTELFSANLRRVLHAAWFIAVKEGKKRVSLRHLLAALVAVPDTAAQTILREVLSLDPQKIYSKLVTKVPLKQVKESLKTPLDKDLPLHASVKDVLFEALKLSKRTGAYYVGAEHVFLTALVYIYKNKRVYPRLFRIFKLDKIDLETLVFNVLQRSLTPVRILEQQLRAGDEAILGTKPISADLGEAGLPEEAIFAAFTKDVLQDAIAQTGGKYILQRDEYISKILAALQSRVTRNVLLVGESGVGKTYLVYDLALRISKGEVPFYFANKKIVRLSLPEIVATSKFPLDMEKRIMAVFNYIYGKEDIILFIDNMQHILHPSPKGGVSLYTLLLPILESGKVQILATMPKDEFRLFSEYATAFNRVFNVVQVEEPSEAEVLEILRLYLMQWEPLLKVFIDNKSLQGLVKLTNEYLQGMVQPQKAVSTLDAVISKKLLEVLTPAKKEFALKNELKALEGLKDTYLELGDVAKLESIQKQAELLEKELFELGEERKRILNKGIVVKEQDIRSHLAQVTGLPLYSVSTEERVSLLQLEKVLKKRIVAQDEAVKKVAYAIKRGRLGIKGGNRPWASFLFLGPTGVGKSELAKTLARYLFGDDKERLIQIDMSEFMESHSVSRLIGSPPGYVGHEKGGYLTERVKKNPYSVVLFDEIEKAADNVLNILLQILEDGRLTDSKGETVSFKNTIIILTSNIGAEEIFKDKVLGFLRDEKQSESVTTAYESMKEMLIKELYRKLRPELINRLDDIIIFRTLTKKDAARILEILLEDLNALLKEKYIEVVVLPRGKRFLVNKGFSKEFGARALRRVLQEYVENTVADYILQRGWKLDPIRRKPRKIFLDYNKHTKRLEVSKVEL